MRIHDPYPLDPIGYLEQQARAVMNLNVYQVSTWWRGLKAHGPHLHVRRLPLVMQLLTDHRRKQLT